MCLTGKTTILGMLTRRTQPTSGDALVDGQSVLSSSGQAPAVLGFCPQQDPLMDLLTGREHLALYARLKVGHDMTLGSGFFVFSHSCNASSSPLHPCVTPER